MTNHIEAMKLAKQTPIKKNAEKLQAELANAWREIETLPIAELGARNKNVLEYMHHWENRAITAEKALEQCQESLWKASVKMPEPKQAQPVAWRAYTITNGYTLHFHYGEAHRVASSIEPLYTAPPQRQPLTDEQIAHATAPVLMSGKPSLTAIARAIEAAHGIYAPTGLKGEA